ncbi:ABC transporter ATP-binding protein [Ideonella sp. DXS22W]|uniref:ABC transporter ATP-binding protein n=1 Tax=Pseudaquabacterium inlustre TaxID=2984192 RepID=A0ABU9CMW7_9BURK
MAAAPHAPHAPTAAAPASPQAALAIEGVRKTFGGHEILKGIDLDVPPGGFLILVGPSGCGKSTLLNIIAGLEAPSAGTLRLGGRDITRAPAKDRDIAMVFQSYALYPNMNVTDNIAFALEMRGVPRAARQAAVQRVAEMLQIGHLLQRKPGQLSGGQRQRVAMGRALAREPRLFLFDEPLSNLDAKLRVEMRAEIKLLHQRTRTTTVYVTHDQVEAMTLGDRIAVMKDGAVQQWGTPDDIYDRPATRFVAEFIGSPPMNLLDVQTASAAGTVQTAGLAMPLPPATQAALAAGSMQGTAPGSAWHYGLRPEDLQLQAPDGPQALLRGQVLMREPTGPETYLKISTPLGVLTARVPGKVAVADGEAVGLGWRPDRVHLFAADAAGARVG